jgi:cyclomaltodextrinase
MFEFVFTLLLLPSMSHGQTSHDKNQTFAMDSLKIDVPTWAKGAVFYQIFPERFRNGDSTNDPHPQKRKIMQAAHPWTSNWYKLTDDERDNSPDFYHNIFERRYGGDLKGIIDKLDYLKDLGIDVIYLNPVFEALSLHKYDASAYHHIDVNFGPDPKGDRHIMAAENPADPETWKWTAADKLFLQFVEAAHQKGMRVILDGVFNHVGRKFWAFQDLIQKQHNSAYKDWFIVTRWDAEGGFEYKGWWETKSLPEFQKSDITGLALGPRDHIFAVTKRWMQPSLISPSGKPYAGIDGWRLDVANEVPHVFWKDWRKLVRSLNPEAYISGEIWDDAYAWLQGDEFDAVMNYPFAKSCVNFFIDKKNKITATEFMNQLTELLKRYPDAINHCLMNLFDSHDTDRLASMIVNPDRRYDHASSPRYNPNYDLRKPNTDEIKIQKLMVLFQMTYIGSPTIYYGSEAGMWGADDPDDRKPMIWADLTYEDESYEDIYNVPTAKYPVRFDANLFAFYKKAIALHKTIPVLQQGSFKVILTDDAKDVFAFERTLDKQTVSVIFNNSKTPQTVSIPVAYASLTDKWSGKRFAATDGVVSVKLGKKSAVILVKAGRGK